VTHHGKALAFGAKQALQIVASLAQAISAINPAPELVQKMIGSPRYLQDRLRMLLENPVPEKAVVDDTSWKVTLVCQKIDIHMSSLAYNAEVVKFDLQENTDPWQKDRGKTERWQVGKGVVHGFVTNKDFQSFGELLRAAMNTEDERDIDHEIKGRGLVWDISQIVPFLSKQVWDGENPLNLRTDSMSNLFFVVGPDGELRLVRIAHDRSKGQNFWSCRAMDYKHYEPSKNTHIYFRNNPAEPLSDHERMFGLSRH